MSTMAKTQVVFPPPPPTTNSLTTRQRNQLLRRTKKLEQILGATPHLLDTSASAPTNFVQSERPKRRSSSASQSRISVDSLTSTSITTSCGSGSHPFSSFTEQSSTSSLPQINLGRSSLSLRKTNSSPLPDLSNETWSETRPPVLRISLSGLNQEENYWSSSSPSRPYTLTPSPDSDSEDPDTMPSFNIMGSYRKVKMDRLRRKLGNGIPVNLVFPENEVEVRSIEVSSSSEDDSPTSPVGSPIPRPSRSPKPPGSISGSRDSLSEYATVHRAPRHSPNPEFDLSPPPGIPKPSPLLRPSPIIATSRSSPPPQTRGQLVAIIESPDEHGTGCTEDFGRPRAYSSGSSDCSQQWSVGGNETEIRLWSTRRGYEGWSLPAPRNFSKRSWSLGR